jgi:hypothetical protein
MIDEDVCLCGRPPPCRTLRRTPDRQPETRHDGARTLFCAAALALGASNDESPEGGVAKVGEAVITKSDFERARKLVSDPADPRDDGSKGQGQGGLDQGRVDAPAGQGAAHTVTDAELQEAVDQGRKIGFLTRRLAERWLEASVDLN